MTRQLGYHGLVIDTRWLDEREMRAWRGFQAMQMRLEGELARRLLAESGMSYQDYAVLVALTDQPDGRLRQYALAEVLGWEKSRVSHHIARMTRRELVSRETCASDARGTFVVVTDQGRRQIEAAAPGHLDAVRELFIDRLDSQQLETLAAIAGRVLAALDEGEGNRC